MRRYVSGAPYALKDPRFSYTLPAWRPLLREGTRFVCVFRHPAEVAASLLTDWRTNPSYYGDFVLTRRHALRQWICINRLILERHARAGEWLFVHHAALVAGEATAALSDFTGADLDASFIEPSLRRSPRYGAVPAQAKALYEQLLRRSPA
jgi:hypothetical protein